ncbi:MAG: haloacid dehalogenase [Chloroflexi bacterium]|nr:haloacid dehalogenase [Chloroflexota bacterium]
MAPDQIPRLDEINNRIRQCFTDKDLAREKALRACRESIRHSANAIRAVHRRDYDASREVLKLDQAILREAGGVLAGYGDLLNSGFMHDAQKEYAEANITLALVTGAELPAPEELSVGYAAYLNGMGEAVGELRRFLLDSLRAGDYSPCETLLSNMDDIYQVLVTMDFPDAITYGLRRTTDVTRGILEKTRGDLTLAIREKEIELTLSKLNSGLKEHQP